MRRFLALAVLLCAAAFAPAGASASPTGSIAGSVTEASGGGPLEGVEVCAREVKNEIGAGCTFTGPDGSYLLAELPAGEYKIEFWPQEGPLLPQLYDHKYSFGEADVVSMEDGEAVAGIDAALEPGGEISGTVYSEASEAPLEKIEVCVVRATSGELSGCIESDEDGRYLFSRLAPGDYKVAFSLDFSEFFEEELEQEDDGFQTQFWDGQTTLAAANVIPLASAQSVADIDAHLELNPPPPPPTPPPPSPPTPPLPSGSAPAPALDSPLAAVGSLPLSSAAPEAEAPAPSPHCRKGRVLKKVKGSLRCVKKRRHRHHGRRGG